MLRKRRLMIFSLKRALVDPLLFSRELKMFTSLQEAVAFQLHLAHINESLLFGLSKPSHKR